MEVREENLAVLGGVVATELLVEGRESRECVVALDAPPVIESLNRNTRQIFAL